MSVLSDQRLADLWPDAVTGSASVDLHMGDTLLAWPTYVRRDPRIDQSDRWQSIAPDLASGTGLEWILKPGQRYLAATRERVKILPHLAGFLSARSSWGRDGLAVICGPAGFLDPGYVGNPTLELSVVGSELVIWPGAAICQLVLHELTEPCMRPYSGKYLLDSMPTPSRLFQEVSR